MNYNKKLKAPLLKNRSTEKTENAIQIKLFCNLRGLSHIELLQKQQISDETPGSTSSLCTKTALRKRYYRKSLALLFKSFVSLPNNLIDSSIEWYSKYYHVCGIGNNRCY